MSSADVWDVRDEVRAEVEHRALLAAVRGALARDPWAAAQMEAKGQRAEDADPARLRALKARLERRFAESARRMEERGKAIAAVADDGDAFDYALDAARCAHLDGDLLPEHYRALCDQAANRKSAIRRAKELGR